MGSESMDRRVEKNSKVLRPRTKRRLREAIFSEIDLTVTECYGRQRALWRSSFEAKRLD